jgi:hypothetical protein
MVFGWWEPVRVGGPRCDRDATNGEEIDMRTMLIGVGALALGVVVPVGVAGADPKPADDVEVVLTCDGDDYPITTAGNGRWTPAHDLGSTLVGVPIAFGEFEGTFTPDGGTPERFTEPAFEKPNAPRTANLILTCTYTVEGPVPYGYVEGEGSVTIMVPRVKP